MGDFIQFLILYIYIWEREKDFMILGGGGNI